MALEILMRVAEVQAEKIATDVEAPGAGYIVDRVAVNVPVLQGSPICRIVDSVEKPAKAMAERATVAEREMPQG